jgi:hypothetical protein
MNDTKKLGLIFLWSLLVVILAILYFAFARGASAKDIYATPSTAQWYDSLMMPDSINTSYCGHGEAYWADKTDKCRPSDNKDYLTPTEFANECALVAIITDTRPDTLVLPASACDHNDENDRKMKGKHCVLTRVHVPVGTRVVIMKSKIRKHPSMNPTGHNIVFLSGYYLNAYCWEPLAQF